MTSLTIRAFPLNGGSVDDLKAFIAEINGPRSEEACQFYRRYGVVREVCISSTPKPARWSSRSPRWKTLTRPSPGMQSRRQPAEAGLCW